MITITVQTTHTCIPRRRDTTEYSYGTTIRIYTVNISEIFRIEIGAQVLQLV